MDFTQVVMKDSHENEDYDQSEARKEYISRMANLGFSPVFPSENELQIDIDDEVHQRNFDRLYGILDREYCVSMVEHPSKSGLPSKHVTVTLPFKVDVWMRIAFQASLGSDQVRELLSAIRAHRGEDNPTLFMERSVR